MRSRCGKAGVLAGVVVALGGCGYLGLLRPSVLSQLNPRVVRLVNYFPSVDHPNEAVVARLVGHGGLSRARPGEDGVMRSEVRAPADQFIWEPSIVVMPRPGELELRFTNEDHLPHAAIVPDASSEKQLLDLPRHTAGIVRVRLGQPGMYTFACPVENHAGRGMLGLILVGGEVPPEARLDRPEQPRP